MGASFGQMGGSIAAYFAVACFTAGTPLVVDREGNSRPIDEIEVGDFVLARSEFDPDGPLELKRERPLNRILHGLVFSRVLFPRIQEFNHGKFKAHVSCGVLAKCLAAVY